MNTIPSYSVNKAKNKCHLTHKDLRKTIKKNTRRMCHIMLVRVSELPEINAQYGFQVYAGDQKFTAEDKKHITALLAQNSWKYIDDRSNPVVEEEFNYWLEKDSNGKPRFEKFFEVCANYMMITGEYKSIDDYVARKTAQLKSMSKDDN